MNAVLAKSQELRDLGYCLWRDTSAYTDNPHALHMEDIQRRLTDIERAVREARAALACVEQEAHHDA